MISVVGLGYIGLPIALMFAARGVEVVGVDKNEELVRTLKHRKLTFEERGFDELFNSALNNKIQFQTDWLKIHVHQKWFQTSPERVRCYR